MATIKTFIKKRGKLAIAIGILVVLLIGGFVGFRGGGVVETTSIVNEDLVRTVKIAGKVIPRQSANLGFETAGTVAAIGKDVGAEVKRGDVLASLDTSSISAQIRQAEAELTLAQAGLTKLEGAGTYEAQIDNAKRSLIQSIFDAYTASDDAVHNKTDQVFIDPRISLPQFKYAFKSNYDLRDSIVARRPTLDAKLGDWKILTRDLTLVTYTTEHLSKSKTYLAEISSYITDVAQAVNLFEASGSLTQDDIDTYKGDALSARDKINAASNNLITSEEKLQNLLLDVPVQVARVESARASLTNYRAQQSKYYIVSPINGVVSKQDAKIGQAVSATTEMVSVISKDLEIEAFIPEVLVSGVMLDNPAYITLDAYGDTQVFVGKIVHIDPAETIRDGVSTYKVRIAFNTPDDRPRSGMTANISIETFRKRDTKLIPERAVVRDGDETYVYILNNDKSQDKLPVTIGERDSKGNVELISDISPDTKLIINPPTNQ